MWKTSLENTSTETLVMDSDENEQISKRFRSNDFSDHSAWPSSKDSAGFDDVFSSVPMVVNGRLESWEPLSWDLDQWKLNLGKQSLKVRFGPLSPPFNHPQWERSTKEGWISGEDLFSVDYLAELRRRGEWVYFDYNYMKDIFQEDILKKFDWEELGFKGRTGLESTLWIGSQGAHTPCHQDCYGYNLVAQLYGSKAWTLISPQFSSSLSPTRIPYEESSVYSRINFQHLALNSPDALEALGSCTVYSVTLQPGDVLYVPRHWWHFVTNLNFAISVNTWVECEEDHEARIQEALVRVQAAQLIQSLTRDDLDELLNPNEDDLVNCDIQELTDLTVDLVKTLPNKPKKTKFPRFGPDWVPLKPGTLDLPLSAPHPGLQNRKSVFSLFDAITSKPVIQSAVDGLKKTYLPQ